jgi:hypothetical protein
MDYVTSLCFVNFFRSRVVTIEASPALQHTDIDTDTSKQ